MTFRFRFSLGFGNFAILLFYRCLNPKICYMLYVFLSIHSVRQISGSVWYPTDTTFIYINIDKHEKITHLIDNQSKTLVKMVSLVYKIIISIKDIKIIFSKVKKHNIYNQDDLTHFLRRPSRTCLIYSFYSRARIR